MSERPTDPPRWNAAGLLFENCTCQVVCPGHFHFSQVCTVDPCNGYWAIRFDEGEFDGIALAGTAAVLVYESPQHMIEGGWRVGLIVDERASPGQREAIEAILTGKAGGPWEVLARFFGERSPTRYEPIEIAQDGRTLSLRVGELLEGSIKEIRGRDRAQAVTFDNIFNQIHGSRQVIARGSTTFDDGRQSIRTEGTHGLHSRFDWSEERA